MLDDLKIAHINVYMVCSPSITAFRLIYEPEMQKHMTYQRFEMFKQMTMDSEFMDSISINKERLAGNLSTRISNSMSGEI